MTQSSPVTKPRRHLYVPDTQTRIDTPTEHIPWIAQACIDYKPDVIVVGGDWFDMASLSSYDAPGSKRMEGARYEDDINAGNAAFKLLNDPIQVEIARLKRNKKAQWLPELHFLHGNHENRITRAVNKEPKLEGVIGLHHLLTPGWEQHEFLKVLDIDGIKLSHYFQNSHSSYAIGGSIDNRLNKIGDSFAQFHCQGFMYGNRIFPTGKTKHGIVAGSCCLHSEDYRGPQGAKHWNGIVVLNEVVDGDFDVMPVSLSYLKDKYG